MGINEEYLPIGSEKDERNKKGYVKPEVVAELEALYAKTAKQATAPLKPQEPKPITTVAQKQEPASNTQPYVTPQPSEQQPRPSLDEMIRKGLDRKKQQIFEKAKTDYENTENKFYDNLFAMIDSAANYSNPFQPIPRQPQPLPQAPPQLQQTIKDNSEAIHLIELSIMDPKTKNLSELTSIKRKLQGLPVEEEAVTPTVSPKVVIPKPKEQRNYSLKVGLVLFGLVTLVTVVILYLFTSGIL